jgi:hypothetical protein
MKVWPSPQTPPARHFHGLDSNLLGFGGLHLHFFTIARMVRKTLFRLHFVSLGEQCHSQAVVSR